MFEEISDMASPFLSTLIYDHLSISWSASWLRLTQQLGVGTETDKTPLEAIVAWINSWFAPISLDALGVGHLSGPLSSAQRYALAWLVIMDCYVRQVQEGLSITAWRYADLNHKRQETLSRLFATCGLPVDAVQLALAGFEQDSQKGTVMARAEESQGNPIRLNHEQEEEIRAIVRCHPLIQTTDFVAPGTIAISGS